MTTEQLAEAYDDGWVSAVFATCPEGMSGEAQLLRAVKLPPADNPHRDGPRLSRLAGDRAIVAHELAIAVDGGTEDLATWVRVVDALFASGALREVSLSKRQSDSRCGCCWCCSSTPPDQRGEVHKMSCAVAEQREEGRRLASQREDLIVGGADPNELAVPLHPQGGCADPGCGDCRTEWGPVMSGVATYVTDLELERLSDEYGVPIHIDPDRNIARFTLGERIYLTSLEATS